MTRGYDNGGWLTSSSYNNGVSESRSYNNDNTLASISFSGASIGTYSYSWDANGNKTAESISGTMSGYGFSVGASGYDAEDRMVNWERSDTNLDQVWSLSAVDDWNSITENASTQNRTHGGAHELLTAASQTVQHDAKGNMTLIPAVLRSGSNPLAMKWDFGNRLASADTNNDGTDDVFYTWDALGRRVGRDDGTSNTVYFQDGQQTIADYPAGTVATSPSYTYIYGEYIDEPVLRTDSAGGKLYYHRNGQYSIVALTDGIGAITERYAYTAYGEPTILDGAGTVLAGSTNRHTYTGREWDSELELYHYRARMYNPVAGRFVSRDPIGVPYGLNEYLLPDALSSADPSGNSSVNLAQKISVSGGCGFLSANIVNNIRFNSFTPSTHNFAVIIHKAGYNVNSTQCTQRTCGCFEGKQFRDVCGFYEIFGLLDLSTGEQIYPVIGRRRNRQISTFVDRWRLRDSNIGSCGFKGTIGAVGTVKIIGISDHDVRRLGNIPYRQYDRPCTHMPGGGPRTNPGPRNVPLTWWFGNNALAEATAVARVTWNCCDGNQSYSVFGIAGNGFVSNSN